jgi:hypothetical protein
VATTLTPVDSAELTYFSFPIEKHEDTDTVNPADGTPDIVVYGKATDGTVDSDLQIVDPDWSGKALQEWLDTGGNLRVQHQAKRDPAGVGLGVELTADGHYVRSLVSEPVAKHLVRTGALKDYSIGVSWPDIQPDPSGKAMNGVITGRKDGKTKVAELSLVDRGSNFNSRFQLVKAASDGTPEFVGKMMTMVDVQGSAITTDDLRKIAQNGVAVTKTRGDQYEGALPGVSVTLPDDVSVSFKPSDLAKLLDHRRQAEKRNMDPNVGGGVDRDKLDESDFAGRNRSFPIVTPGDVSDAASSIGRAGSDNYSSDQLKRNIIRIARRKGPEFEAKLPDAWKDGSGKAADPDTVKGAKDCPKCGKSYHADSKMRECENCGTDLPSADDADKAVIPVEDSVTKKDKVVCAGCGANHDAGHNFCPECGKKAGAKDIPVSKNHDYTCLGCGKGLDDGEKYCPGCGKQNPGFDESEKAAAIRMALKNVLKGDDVTTDDDKSTQDTPAEDVATPDTVKAAANSETDDDPDDNDDDTPNPADTPDGGGDDGNGDDDADKAATTVSVVKDKSKKVKKHKAAKAASPADGVEEAAPTKPAPGHREPDGSVVATLESDAGMASDRAGDSAHDNPDYAAPKARGALGGSPEIDALMRLKSLNVPVDMGKLHDLTCPCYHPDDVAKCYPTDSLATLDIDYWQTKAFDMAAGAPMDKAQEAALLWQQVVTLKNTDPTVLEELKSEAYKAFQDANPGPGTAPTPTTISPTRFNRGYLTAGHSATSPGHDGPNSATIPANGGISAADYQRGFLSAGRGADSPANSTSRPEPIQAPAVTGTPTRTFYSNLGRDNARQAMSAMHDHIAQTFPDLCPAFTGSPYQNQTPPPAPRPVPTGVGMPTPHTAPTTKTDDPENERKMLKKQRRRLERAVLAGEMTLDAARAELASLIHPAEPVVEKTGEAEVTKAVTLDVDTVQSMITKAVAERDAQIVKLQQQIEALANEPEPGGPYRGVALGAPTVTKTSAAPEALPSMGHAERAQQFLFNALREQWRNDPDPTQREVALAELMKMSGIGNTVHK